MNFVTRFLSLCSALVLAAASLDNAGADDIPAREQTALAAAKEAVVHGKTPADLDAAIKELQALQMAVQLKPPGDDNARALTVQCAAALDFLSQWQNYLSDSAAGKDDEAKQVLNSILATPRLLALWFVPRSAILERLNGAPIQPPPPGATPDANDPENLILAQIKNVGEIDHAMNEIMRLSPSSFDLPDIVNLEHDRVDVIAGLPTVLDLKSFMASTTFGDDISRIEAMELLAILPYYFGTHDSNPPKKDESLNAYLDRLAASAYSSENLGLYQQVLTVKAALLDARPESIDRSSLQFFLAGLSQEMAGQCQLAVVSYEHALENYDKEVPVKIVGQRLAGIKTAHPEEYQEGLETFLNPAEAMDMAPRFPGRHHNGNNSMQATVPPIPKTLSIPARDNTGKSSSKNN